METKNNLASLQRKDSNDQGATGRTKRKRATACTNKYQEQPDQVNSQEGHVLTIVHVPMGNVGIGQTEIDGTIKLWLHPSFSLPNDPPLPSHSEAANCPPDHRRTHSSPSQDTHYHHWPNLFPIASNNWEVSRRVAKTCPACSLQMDYSV